MGVRMAKLEEVYNCDLCDEEILKEDVEENCFDKSIVERDYVTRVYHMESLRRAIIEEKQKVNDAIEKWVLPKYIKSGLKKELKL